MTVGTKSLLFGVHAFWLHPFIVAIAWTRLYGFPLDPRLWIAFIVHDLGYWGCITIDGEDGRDHPELGAEIMDVLFGPEWGDFVLYHSRGTARRYGAPVSRLCLADKLAWTIEPWWMYIPRATLSENGTRVYRITLVSPSRTYKAVVLDCGAREMSRDDCRSIRYPVGCPRARV